MHDVTGSLKWNFDYEHSGSGNMYGNLRLLM